MYLGTFLFKWYNLWKAGFTEDIMKFICSSCGAEIDDTMPKCPYCDTLIMKGAEAQYMEKLYDIQEDMEELKEIPFDVVEAEVKHQGRRMKKIIIIALIVILAFVVIFMFEEKKYDRDVTADYIWEQTNFPIMSELYENGEYEELEEMYYDALMDDKPVWNWEYYDEFSDWLDEQ